MNAEVSMQTMGINGINARILLRRRKKERIEGMPVVVDQRQSHANAIRKC